MTANPHHFRDLLTQETAHLGMPEKQLVTACLHRARELADQWTDAPVTPVQLPHAIALKLIELPDAPPAWVRVLVAKAALESVTASALAA